MLDPALTTLDTALEDDAATGAYRVGRDIFTDPAVLPVFNSHASRPQGNCRSRRAKPVMLRIILEGVRHNRP